MRGRGEAPMLPPRPRGWRSLSAIGRLPAADTAAPPAPDLRTVAVAPERERLQWTLVFAGLVIYLFVTISYRLNIAAAAMGLALVGLIVFQRERLRLPGPLIWLGVFIVWCAAGLVRTEYPTAVAERLDALVKIWLIALVTANALRTRAQLRWFVVLYLGFFALFPIRGAVLNAYVYHNTRFGRASWINVFNNPNDLAAIAILHLGMCAAILVREPKGWVRWAALAGVTVVPLVVLATQSRAGFLALAAFAAFAFLGHSQKLRFGFRIAVVALLAALAAPSTVWERVGGLARVDRQNLEAVDPEGSARQRYEIWRIAGKIIREHALTGVGTGAYTLAHERYALGEEFDPTGRGPRDTHSTYLNILAETGYPGLVLFLGMLAASWKHARAARRRAARVAPEAAAEVRFLELGLLAFLIAGVFGSFGYISFFYVHLMLLWAFAARCSEEAALASAGVFAEQRASVAGVRAASQGARPADRPRQRGQLAVGLEPR